MTACKKFKLALTGTLYVGVIPNHAGSKQEMAQENEENMDDLSSMHQHK